MVKRGRKAARAGAKYSKKAFDSAKKHIRELVRAGIMSKGESKKLMKALVAEMRVEKKRIEKFAKAELKRSYRRAKKTTKPYVKKAVKRVKKAARRRKR